MTAVTAESHAGAAERLLGLAMAAKVADLLEALAETGVLDHLAAGPVEVGPLAAALGLDAAFLDVALAQAARFGYVAATAAGGYALTPAARAVTAVLDLERASARWHRSNGSLPKVLRGGGRQDPLDSADAAALRPVYDRALGGVVRMLALNVARHLPMAAGRPLVVDLGGGDGSLAVALHQCRPVRAVVVDRPATQAAFDRRVPEVLRTEVRFQALDLRAPAGLGAVLAAADLVVMSNIVHLLNPAERAAVWHVLATAAMAGEGEGEGAPMRVLVYDQFPGEATAAGAAEGWPGLGDLMVIDWLRCGVRFDLTAAHLAEEAGRCGLRLERIASPLGLPGRLVVLGVP